MQEIRTTRLEGRMGGVRKGCGDEPPS